MRVVVVAEYYPRRASSASGVWAHRQALAARDAGADVRVIVLHRLVPTLAAVRTRRLGRIAAPLLQPLRARLDGIPVTYVPFVSPFRGRSYGSWGAWAAPTLTVALRALGRAFPYELVHAHYAAPAGDAVRRSRIGVPLVVSVHGGDIYWVAHASPAGERAVKATFSAARLVLANSRGIERRCRALGARRTRVVHLGADPPADAELEQHAARRRSATAPTIATVANLVERKRHADVLRAMWLLRDAHPSLRWLVVGEGPERQSLERLARDLGIAERVEFRGALPHRRAVAAARSAEVFVLPSVAEAFGVAYIEAMAGAVPAIGCRGEPGPEELADRTAGMTLVPPAEPQALADALNRLLADEALRTRLGEDAARTIAAEFSWQRCGRETVAAYEHALATVPGR